MQHDADAPLFLRVEVYEGFVLHLALQIFARSSVRCFGKSTTGWLDCNLDRQIVWRRSLYDDEERTLDDVRISPNENQGRPDLLIDDDRKRWSIVCERASREREKEKRRREVSHHPPN